MSDIIYLKRIPFKREREGKRMKFTDMESGLSYYGKVPDYVLMDWKFRDTLRKEKAERRKKHGTVGKA